MKVTNAIKRLTRILPIKSNLDALDADTAKVYQAVVNAFYEWGRAPTLQELQLEVTDAAERVGLLAAQDMLTVNQAGEVTGCYPFTMEPRVHQVDIHGHRLHAMCALDALAPSAMFECPSVVASECAVSQLPVRVELENQNVLNAEETSDVFFGINWAAASACGSCSESLCTEMLFLKGVENAQSWLNQDTGNREIFTLAEAIEFAAGFFKPMMQQE